MPNSDETERHGPKFEREIAQALDAACPHSRLSRVLLFRPDLPEHRRYGFEIDHLLHVRDGLVDRLFIIECKARSVTVVGHEWQITFNGEVSNAKHQLRNQSISLLRHLAGHEPGRQLKVEACLVSWDSNTPPMSEASEDNAVTFHLFGRDRFLALLATQQELVQRVEQSSILSQLRQGVAVSELGRPDVSNAIVFVKECRRALDNELYRRFPSSERMTWSGLAAINGTAGMGKSVMLAYILFVLSCDHFIKADETTGTGSLEPLGDKVNDLQLPKHAQRSIVAFGMSQKQVNVLRALWRHFVQLFGTLESGHLLHFHQPIFKVWDASIPDECNILLVDEAHDLPLEAQRIIQRWKDATGETRYLLVACDRHQRLRLHGFGAAIIAGLNFSSHTLRLRRNYRSPFPVYAASIALMFRWYAVTGPKVIPTRDELYGSFGFKVESQEAGHSVVLSNINDSHPGNHWCYTVSRFLAPQDALRQIQNLRRDDVLWVRFCEEDSFFDYEQLSAFTYHPMDGGGVPALIDKYIKGQDYSVVVIEGLPPHTVPGTPLPDSGEPAEVELRMWHARRELYLCASRANVLLFFVLKPGTAGEDEIEAMLRDLRAPYDAEKRLWSLRFGVGQPTRRPGDVDPTPPTEPTPPAVEAIITLRLAAPVKFGALVASLRKEKGLDPKTSLAQVLEAVAPFELEKLGSDTALPIDRLSELEDKLGVLIEVQDADGSPVVQPATPVPVPATVPTENEAALRSGMTVAQAASILGLSIQRLFDLLPPPYQATTELKESDLQRLSPLGVVTKQRDRPTPMITPPSVVRTTAPTAVPAALPAAGIWRTSLAEQLWQFEQQPVFTRERTMIAKYVLFLAELIRLKPSASEILLNYRPRTRAYFARSSAEILSESPYASVHQLRHGGLFAMGTLQDSSKFTVIRRVLGDCGLPPEDIRRLLGDF